MEALLTDIRLAFRVLLKAPLFTVIAICAIALGIAANTAIFSVVSKVLLQPLPYRNPDRIVAVERKFREGTSTSISVPRFMEWRKATRSFDAVAVYASGGPGFNLSTGGAPELVKGMDTSADLFRVFGVNPILGRTFTASEDLPNAPQLVILSEGLWRNRFASDRGILGRTIHLSSQPYTVIGVLPADIEVMQGADVFTALKADPNSTDQGNFLRCIARLKSGVPLAAGEAEMGQAAARFGRLYPKWVDVGETAMIVPLRNFLVGDIRTTLLVLVTAVAFVLLIACANVANLLLARAASRQREIAIRTAIGAGRFRIIRQLLTESVLLASIGGAIGLVLGAWGIRALLALSPGDVPRIGDLSHAGVFSLLDWRVVLFTVVVTFLTGILFGLVPAIQVSRVDLNSTLKESNSRGSTSQGHNRARGVLVAAEMGLAVVLLIGAGLLIRTFIGLRAVHPGFNSDHVLRLLVSMSGDKYSKTAPTEAFTTEALRRIEALPGVQSASVAAVLPLDPNMDLPFKIEGRPLPKGRTYTGDEYWRYGGPHFFDVLGIPLIRGRVFTQSDTGSSPPVIIISETMAKKYWANADPIGQRITIGGGLGPSFVDRTRTIVGVVGSVREEGLAHPLSSTMYLPYGQIPDGITALINQLLPVNWLIRTQVAPLSLTSAIERELHALGPDVPIAKVQTVEQVLAASTARQNFNMLLLTIFAGMALLLAAIGIYGLMSYAVEQRTHEIGIRMALGAVGGQMTLMVVSQAMRLAVIGLVAGLATAYAVSRGMASLLFGVEATDPLTYVGVTVALAAVALVASYVPAHRATKVDPMMALRYE